MGTPKRRQVRVHGLPQILISHDKDRPRSLLTIKYYLFLFPIIPRTPNAFVH